MDKSRKMALDLRQTQRELLLQLLREHVPQAEVWAYGSRVTGGAHEGSDLDLVVRRRDAPLEPADGVAALREALTRSNLPMLVDVHDWADLPPAFRMRIEQAHVRLN